MVDGPDSQNTSAEFLFGDSKMIALLRAFDWSQTVLGPIADWPVEVKTVVAMMMYSPLPMLALFGEPGTMIYNDAYANFAGPRHPDLLGAEVRTGWAEIADFKDSVIKTVFRDGKTLTFRDEPLLINRGSGLQQVWLNLDYSPLLGGAGKRVGVIGLMVETTTNVLAALRLQNQEVRLQQMFDQTPSFMALLDGPEHRFIMANPAYRKLVGHRDILSQTVAEALPEIADADYLAMLDQVYTSGVASRLSGAAYDVQDVPQGQPTRRYIDMLYQPITDASGAVTGIFVDGTDVTDVLLAQDATRASDAQFRGFSEVMPNHVWTARPNGHLDWLNARVSEYSGRPQEQLFGVGWTEIVHPADRPDAAGRWSAALEAGTHYETEFRIRDAAGEYRWHLVRASPIRDSDGTIIKWIGTNTDIHAQKLAEAETTRDRNRLWAMSQDLMLVCDFNGVITAVNPSAERMLGWKEDEMVGKALTDFVHPDDAAGAASEVGMLVNGAKTLAFENRYLCKDGSYRMLDWTAVPDESRIHGVGRDITEYRRLSRDRDRIWNISPGLKLVMEFGGLITNVNPSWTKVLGWGLAETVGRNILEFVGAASLENIAVKLEEASKLTGILQTESIYKTKGGGTRRIAWSTVRDGATLYAFGRDITAESEAAAALASSQAALRQAQKMEAIGQLTGGVAHDFNNLLQVVSGNLQLLGKEVAGNERGERRIHNAMEAVSGGARLASQLLAFGRRQPLAPKVVNLGRLVRSIDDILRRALGEAIEIETIVTGGLWNTLVDPGNVENALLNLAINARDAMEGRGNLTIEVGNAYLDDDYVLTTYEVNPGQYVVLSVTDTGTGIQPDLLDKVFEPFFTTKAEGKGTGLGLSMVYGFVKQSGGHVKIYSELGQGTTIRLYLPRAMEAEDQVVVQEFGPITGGAETILVVEDDTRVRETVIETLNDLGYRVLQASEPQAALSVIESGIPIDMLFTDVVMPGRIKSAELARMASERLPGLKVLFTSGYSENSIVHGGRLDHGVELLSKPYTREALARKVRLLLSAGGAKAQEPEPAAILVPQADEATGLTLLLCEDDTLICMATTDMLEDLGHTVIAVGTAALALAALAVNPVDVLITDVGLPDMSGAKLVELARSQWPDLAVIFATGHFAVDGFPPDEKTGILIKPYDSILLAGAIAKVAGG